MNHYQKPGSSEAGSGQWLSPFYDPKQQIAVLQQKPQALRILEEYHSPAESTDACGFLYFPISGLPELH